MPKRISHWLARAAVLPLGLTLIFGFSSSSWAESPKKRMEKGPCGESVPRYTIPGSWHEVGVRQSGTHTNRAGERICEWKIDYVEYEEVNEKTGAKTRHELLAYTLLGAPPAGDQPARKRLVGGVEENVEREGRPLDWLPNAINWIVRNVPEGKRRLDEALSFSDEMRKAAEQGLRETSKQSDKVRKSAERALQDASKFSDKLKPKTPVDFVFLATGGFGVTRRVAAVEAEQVVATAVVRAVEESGGNPLRETPGGPTSGEPPSPGELGGHQPKLPRAPPLSGGVGIPVDAVKEGDVVYGLYKRSDGGFLPNWTAETKTKTADDFIRGARLNVDPNDPRYRGSPIFVAAFDKAAKEGAQVHFDLSEMDLGKALKAPLSAEGKGVTSQELRWLKNNWNDFKNLVAKPKFWLNGKETKPPWEWPNPDAPLFSP